MSRHSQPFRLQTVLELRNQEVDRQQQCVNAVLTRQQGLQLQIAQLQQQVRQLMHTVDHGELGWESLAGNQWMAYLQRLRHTEAMLQEQLHHVGLELQQQQRLLTEARQRQKALERLKNNHLEQLRQHQLEQDNRLMDDLAGRAISII